FELDADEIKRFFAKRLAPEHQYSRYVPQVELAIARRSFDIFQRNANRRTRERREPEGRVIAIFVAVIVVSIVDTHRNREFERIRIDELDRKMIVARPIRRRLCDPDARPPRPMQLDPQRSLGFRNSPLSRKRHDIDPSIACDDERQPHTPREIRDDRKRTSAIRIGVDRENDRPAERAERKESDGYESRSRFPCYRSPARIECRE